MKFYDVAYVINLDDRKDRLVSVMGEFNKVGIVVNRFPAIKHEDGVVGCKLSHLEIIKKAKYNDSINVLIFEDDVQFCNGFSDFNFNIINDYMWDMFFLGSRQMSKPVTVSNMIVKLTKSWCAHAYMVNGNFYDKYIDVVENDNRAIDVILGDLMPEINAYAFYPDLVIQRPDYSNILNRHVNYTGLFNCELFKSKDTISCICFSRNRPLQLDGYIRSFIACFDGHIKLTILYDCDKEFDDAYEFLISTHKNILFIKQNDFYCDLIRIIDDNHDDKFIMFGCDDVIYRGKIDIDSVINIMNRDEMFAFSFRLGNHINRSMFHGIYNQPNFINENNILSWDLYDSHQNGDFGYSFELNGTVYYKNIVRSIIDEFKPSTPNILEGGGGGRWSKKTYRRKMACFMRSHAVVPTINTVQRDNPSATILDNLTTNHLLELYNNGFRIDIDKYNYLINDCIHVSELYLESI